MAVADRTDVSPRRARLLAVTAVVGIGAFLPAVVAALGGGFGLTRNDDWAFIATLRTLVDDGTFHLRGPAEMTLVGQIYLGWPVAKLTSTDITALQLTTLVVGTAGLFAMVVLARNVLDLKRSVCVALAVAVTPLWPQLVTTFMTDIWAFAFGAFAVAAVARAVSAERTRGFLAGLALALAMASTAFTIRQTAAVALLAVITGAAVGLARMRPPRRRERSASLALVALAVLGCAWFYRWRSSLPLGELRPDGAAERGLGLLVNLDVVAVTLGVLLLPASAVFIRRDLLVRRMRALPRAAPVLGIGLGWLVLLKLVALPIDRLTLYDYASRFGAASYSAPQDKIALVPWLPWAVLIVAAAVNVWALIVVLSGPGLRRCWHDQPVLLAVAATMVLGALAMFAVSWIGSTSRFDRYLLPVVPYAALLLAWVGAVGARTAAEGADPMASPTDAVPPLVIGPARAAGLVVLILLASWFGLASASFDRAVHRAADEARKQVGPTVSVGFTVGGTWSTEPPLIDETLTPPGYQCWILRQTSDPSEVVGPVLRRDRLLWVDRWFYLVNAGPGCGRDAPLLTKPDPDRGG